MESRARAKETEKERKPPSCRHLKLPRVPNHSLLVVKYNRRVTRLHVKQCPDITTCPCPSLSIRDSAASALHRLVLFSDSPNYYHTLTAHTQRQDERHRRDENRPSPSQGPHFPAPRCPTARDSRGKGQTSAPSPPPPGPHLIPLPPSHSQKPHRSA